MKDPANCRTMTSRRDLYPPIDPYQVGTLRLDARHAMYWEQSGNSRGAPVLFLRGAGRSTPLGEVKDNTPAHLVADIERLRSLLGIERWLVFGGSWGSTLALVYAATYPQRCAGLILRGIFLCREGEIDWFLYGMGRVFPEAWRAFSEF